MPFSINSGTEGQKILPGFSQCHVEDVLGWLEGEPAMPTALEHSCGRALGAGASSRVQYL